MAKFDYAKLKQRIADVKRNSDIKQVIESTGAQPVYANTAKGEYTYHAPYREDVDPSLKINVFLQKFIDYGLDGSEGDVIELTRRIHGQGDINAMPLLKALGWLESFSGTSPTPKAIKPAQRQSGPVLAVSYEEDRYKFVKADPITTKTHPNNLDYLKARGISLAVASRHLWAVTYKDIVPSPNDPYKGLRFGLGGPNDSGGYEVRAASLQSNFKTSVGPKDVTSLDGTTPATTGNIFEGRFDFLTWLEILGAVQPPTPVIIMNGGKLSGRVPDVIKGRSDWAHVMHWHIWQHNDDEGRLTTQKIADGLEPDGYTVGTVNHLYDGYNDLNKFWTDAQPQERTALMHKVRGTVPVVQKSYDTSVSAEARRTHEERIKNSSPKLF